MSDHGSRLPRLKPVRPRAQRPPSSGPPGGGALRGVEVPLEETCSTAELGSAICVQNFDDSLNSAIRITYRISLRSSSLREPRYPLLKVVSHWYQRGGGVLQKRAPQHHFRFQMLLVQMFDQGCELYQGAAPDTLIENVRRPTSYSPQSTISWIGVVMILPQVHLRKPCYDFTFL